MDKKIALFMGVACMLGAVDPAMGSKPRDPYKESEEYYNNLWQVVEYCREYIPKKSLNPSQITAPANVQTLTEILRIIYANQESNTVTTNLCRFLQKNDYSRVLQDLVRTLNTWGLETVKPEYCVLRQPTELLRANPSSAQSSQKKIPQKFFKELGANFLTSIFTGSFSNPGDSNSTLKKQIKIRPEVDCRFVRFAYDLYNDKNKILSNLNGLDRAAGDPEQIIKFLEFSIENPEVLANMDGLLKNALLRGIVEGFLGSSKATNTEKAMKFLELLASHPDVIQKIDELSANHPIISLAVRSFLVNPENQAVFEQWLSEHPEKKEETLSTILDSGAMDNLLNTQLGPTVELLLAE